jgi:translation initiation factor 1A
MMGANHIRVRCFDGVTRLGRIKGKIKKKVWIREGDILIVVPWSFQDDKCDIIYRYTGPQVEWLRRNGYLFRVIESMKIIGKNQFCSPYPRISRNSAPDRWGVMGRLILQVHEGIWELSGRFSGGFSSSFPAAVPEWQGRTTSPLSILTVNISSTFIVNSNVREGLQSYCEATSQR